VGAKLSDANLSGANLTETVLGGYLSDVDLNGADFSNANLNNADIGGADLRKAKGLTQEQIEKASGSSETKLPAGLSRPDSWSRYSESKAPPEKQRAASNETCTYLEAAWSSGARA
jgi:uncharacterized protein YjbI with pentapeptide repeats